MILLEAEPKNLDKHNKDFQDLEVLLNFSYLFLFSYFINLYNDSVLNL